MTALYELNDANLYSFPTPILWFIISLIWILYFTRHSSPTQSLKFQQKLWYIFILKHIRWYDLFDVSVEVMQRKKCNKCEQIEIALYHNV